MDANGSLMNGANDVDMRNNLNMKTVQFVKSASVIGAAVLIMAMSARATSITYTTNSAGTTFVGSSLVLNDSAGAAATLTFTPNAIVSTGVPSNINLGSFLLACPACTTLKNGTGAFFNPFTFNLVITDLTDGATGVFVGTSSGGSVYGNASGISIQWAPLILGPGTTNALTGDFGTTSFSTTAFTGISAPNSGTPAGLTTVQGYITLNAVAPTAPTSTPEPATLSLMGGALLGLVFLRRRRGLHRQRI